MLHVQQLAIKMEEKKSKKAKKFMEKPEYPGGRKALDAFVAAHLQYPEDAMKQRIEGVVAVAYQVSDEGEVQNATIIKGLCPSCNEEALRIVNMLKYGKAHNRGFRLKANCKLNIHFRLAPAPQKRGSKTTFRARSRGSPNSKNPAASITAKRGSAAVWTTAASSARCRRVCCG